MTLAVDLDVFTPANRRAVIISVQTHEQVSVHSPDRVLRSGSANKTADSISRNGFCFAFSKCATRRGFGSGIFFSFISRLGSSSLASRGKTGLSAGFSRRALASFKFKSLHQTFHNLCKRFHQVIIFLFGLHDWKPNEEASHELGKVSQGRGNV